MLDDLLATVNSAQFKQSEGAILIDAIKRHPPSGFEIELSVHTDVEVKRAWSLRCNFLLSYRFLSSRFISMELSFDHPLLLPHNKRGSELYFSSKPECPSAVYGTLIEAHIEHVGFWFPPERFLNRSMPVIELLSRGNGAIAAGPDSLIEAYSEVLDRFEVRHTILPSPHGLHRWNTDSEPRVLLLDDSYLVAHEIEAKPISGD